MRALTDTHTLALDGYTYVMSHAPGRKLIHATARMGNGFAPLVHGFATGRGPVGRMLGGVAQMLAAPDMGAHLVFLVDTFSPHTQVIGADGKSATLESVFDAHFAGRVKAMFAWLEAVIEWEMGDFLDDMRQKLAALSASDEPPPNATAPDSSGQS